MIRNGNIIPKTSGHTEGSVLGNAWRPWIEVHMESGIFHSVAGTAQSGVIRFDPYNNGMEYSNDGGKTFNAFAAAGGVTSIGVLGDADLTGDIDLAVAPSGFMSIQDTGDASPILFAVDQLGLSGLWNFPSQGLGNVVNNVRQIGNTLLQGIVNFQTVSSGFMSITQTGQNLQWQLNHHALSGLWNLPSNGVAGGYTETIGAASETWNINHGLNTLNIVAQIWDDSSPRKKLDPDDIEATDANNVTIYFNSSQAGKIVIFGF